MISEDKLRKHFVQSTVYKDQNLMATFKSASIPSFLRDWILKKKAGPDGKIRDKEELRKYVSQIIPNKDENLALQDDARTTGASRKFLSRVEVRFNVASNYVSFCIPDLGIKHTETLVENYIWDRIKENIVKTSGGWGVIQLGYVPPEKPDRPKGKITLLEYKNFCPYTVKLDTYRSARANFSIDEWFDILLGAIDYNPKGYSDWVQKHTMLTRLLPFIEPRLNLVELAPKGTGKSYIFGRVGKYGWLVSGGTLTRAKLFYDIQKNQGGLIENNDFVAIDEIQTMRFPDPDEMLSALKAYMESGEATFADQRVVGSAGIILLGNISQDDMDIKKDMFRSLPSVFHESALIDRFHGFIEGRNIPRMNETMKINGWALNTEYFSEIMHLMRSQDECLRYRGVVEDIVDYPDNADTRDTEAILRICTAYVKLLFPHFTSEAEVNIQEFKRYCLRPAVQMRTAIRNQLQLIDPKEYGGKDVAVYTVKDKYEG